MVQAANVSIPVSATVFSVDCTPAQRARFRACAMPVQISSVERQSTLVSVGRAGMRNVSGALREVQVDTDRQVRVLTLLY